MINVLRSTLARAVGVCSLLLLVATSAVFAVESLGTFTWQLVPFCNVLTLALAIDGPIVTLSGYDNGCGAAERQAVIGSGYPNPNGTVGIGLTILSATARPSYVQILLEAGSTSGTWKDDTGHSGSFAFNPGPSPKGAPRDVVVGPCPPDSIKSGAICIDKYENTVWYVPGVLTPLIRKIRLGTVTLADLTADSAPEPVRLGRQYGDLVAVGCLVEGTGCNDIYAVSLPGVEPSGFITWFQAAAAARNSGKRLPTNAEWQAAAFGTPGGSPCNTATGALHATGTPGCVSDVGAFDMVGNLSEWVADWVPRSTGCASWSIFGVDPFLDSQCLSGAATFGPPGAIIRGGGSNPGAGPLSVLGNVSPWGSPDQEDTIGFRSAR